MQPASRAPRPVVACVVAGVAATAVALGVWTAFGAGPLNYDGAYALLWGSQIADGHLPEVQVPLAPTPKPLLIALGAAMSAIGVGHHADVMLLALSVGALGWLVAAAATVAWKLSGWRAAILATAIILTREPVVSWALRGYSEVLFCALIVTVLAFELYRPRTGIPALVLLAVAGLLRPEAWLLSIAYLTWCWPALRTHGRAAGIALTIGAPALWGAFDFVASGVPWWSLTGTRETAQTLARPTGLHALLVITPRRVGEILREPVLVAAVAGSVLLAVRPVRGARQLLAAICAAGVCFAALAVAGLPVIARYLLPIAVLLAIVAATAIVRLLDRQAPPALRASGVALVLWMALTAPGQIQRLKSTASVLEAQREITGELHTLADRGALSSSCPPLSLPNHRPVPSIALWTDSSPFALRTDTHGPAPTGTVLVPGPTARRLFVLDPRDPVKPRAGVPPGFTTTVTGRYWTVAQRCIPTP